VQIAVADSGNAALLNASGDAGSLEISQSRDSDSSERLSGNEIDRGTAVRAALKAGLLGVFIGAVPVIGIVLTGALAVFFYHRKRRTTPSASFAARLGGAAGFVVFAIGALAAMAIIVLHAQQQFLDTMIDTFQKLGANTADPQIRATIRDMFAPAFTPAGQAIAFIVTVVPASVGGLVASFFLRPRDFRE
jgi:hypothetical protein